MALTRRRSRIFVWLALIVAGTLLLAFAGLLAWLRSDDFQRRATAAVELAVETQTCQQLTLGAVHVRLWPPAVELEGFHLWNATTEDTIASAERVRAPVVLRGGGLGLGQLAIVHPVVQLDVGPDGKLRDLSACPSRSGGKPMTELPWSSLLVEDGVVRVTLPEGEIELTGLDVTPVDGPITDITGALTVRWRDLEQTAAIDVANVTLGPDVVAVPQLTLHTDLLTLDGRGEWPLGGDVDVRVKGSVRLEELAPLFAPPQAVLGHVDFDVTVSGPTAEPRIEAAILGSDLGWDKPGLYRPVIHHRFGNLAASLAADREGVEVEKAVLQWGDGRLTVWGRVDPDLRVHDGHVLAENLSLAHVLTQLDAFQTPWVDMLGDADLTVEGTLEPLQLQGRMDFGLADLRVHDGPLVESRSDRVLGIPYGHLEGRWSANPKVVLMEIDQVTTPRSTGRGKALIGTGPGPIDIELDLPQMDLADLRPLGGSELYGKGHVKGRFWGPAGKFQVAGEGDLRDFSVTGLPYADHLVAKFRTPDLQHLYFEQAQGRKGETPYTGDLMLAFTDPMAMDLEITIPDGRIEDVVGVFVDLPGLEGHMEGTLHIAGPLYHMDGESHLALRDVSLWGERFATGEGHGYLRDGLFTLDDLRVRRGDGNEGVILRGGVDREWALNMEVVGDGIELETMDWLRPAELPVSGRLGFVARIDNTLFDPAPHGRITVSDLRYAGAPVADSAVRFATERGVTRYRGQLVGGTVGVEGTLGLWNEQPYALTARLDRFPAHLPYPVAADGEPIEALVSGEVFLQGHFGDEWSPVDVVADATEVRVRWSGQELHNVGHWHYEQRGRSFVLDDFALEGGATRFALSASGGDRPLEVSGTGRVEMDLLRMVVPGLERADGLADVTVSASGRPPEVEAQVDVTLEAGLVRHSAFPGSFEDVRAVLRGGREGYEIVSAEANLGGGTATATGRIAASDWLPTTYDLHGIVQDAQVQWVDYLPPAIGDAEIVFDGPAGALLLSGDVRIDEMTFSDRIDWEDWVVEWRDELLVDAASSDEEPYFSLDVAIGADRTIQLRNNLAEGTASADLRVIGDTSRPGLVGRVVVEDGLAYLQDREFVMDRAEVAFRDPWTWDPDLDFQLVTDISSRERSYRVTYNVLGPFSDWRTEARSDPGLPQADVNALLWFGMTAEELEEIGGLQQAIGQGVADLLLADFFVSNQAAQDLRGELPPLFDRLDLVTGVNARGEYSPDPRLLVEKRLGEEGELELVAEFNLARTDDQYGRVDVPITDAWSLSGWYATRQRDRNLPIGGAYGVDLRARWEAE